MGSLTKVTSNSQYAKYTYSYGGKSYTGIHVFTTKPNTQSIAPGIADPKQRLSNINPAMSTPQKVIAKTNCCMFAYHKHEFHGIFYQGPNLNLYLDGTAYSSIKSVPVTHVAFAYNYYPSFCVKTDGTATIRWFADKYALEAALPFCECILGGVHTLVYDGKCVFNEKVWDNEADSRLITFPQDDSGRDLNADGSAIRNMINIGAANSDAKRTLLGHKAGTDGIYIMVSTDSSMLCKTAANLMLDLGCDYAVNMDGGSPVEMRIKNGYGANGKVTAGGGFEMYSAVCAYLR